MHIEHRLSRNKNMYNVCLCVSLNYFIAFRVDTNVKTNFIQFSFSKKGWLFYNRKRSRLEILRFKVTVKTKRLK